MLVSPNKKYVYTVNENGNGKGEVTAYSFDHTTGKLTLINTQPSNGDAPCHITIDRTNKWVLAANYTGGNFSVYPVLNNGSLGKAVQVIQHAGSSINKSRQEKAHAHAVVFSLDQKFAAVTDLELIK